MQNPHGATGKRCQPLHRLGIAPTPPMDELKMAPVGSARSLLLTVLGELVYPERRPVWSASLLHIMGELGVEESAARQAIARCAAEGWLTREKHSRNVCWEISDTGRKLIQNGVARVKSLSVRPQPWDGQWLILLVTVPSVQRVARRPLYRALSWAGFGNPSPSVWISPYPERRTEVGRVISDHALNDTTLSFTGRLLPCGLRQDEIVANGWGDLNDIAASYQTLHDRYSGLGPMDTDRSLAAYIELVNQLQQLPFLDPQLPPELLPDWIGRRTVAMVQRQRTDRFELARATWREVVRRTAPP